MSNLSPPNLAQNIEIKEIPEMSRIHRPESSNSNAVDLQLEDPTKMGEGSFMSNPPDPVDLKSPPQEDRNQHTFSGKFSQKSKELRPGAGQTGSTMHIKSFSGYGSIKDSVQKETLMSPGVEVQDLDIPHLAEQFVGTGEVSKVQAVLHPDEDFDYEREYQKTREDLQLQNEQLLQEQSHNSTMLMESIKDNQNSQLWGRRHKKTRSSSSSSWATRKTCKSPCPRASKTCRSGLTQGTGTWRRTTSRRSRGPPSG